MIETGHRKIAHLLTLGHSLAMRSLWAMAILVTSLGCEPEVHSVEECTKAGGTVLLPNTGSERCPDGKDQIGAFPFGIEGALCCR
jgi:hypothetical protein